MQRRTYALIDGITIQNNVKEIRKNYPDYQYYFGVVKNNAYHHGIKTVFDLIKGGINYLAVSSLEEAIAIRKYVLNVPILVLEPIPIQYIDDAINNNITITVESMPYIKELAHLKLYGELKVHIALDTGMNRLGLKTNADLKRALIELKQNSYILVEGLYSHFATSGVMDPYYDQQVSKFLEITNDIDLKSIPIIHFARSLSLVEHPKLPFANGVRLGIILYGFSQSRKEDTSLKGRLRTLKRKFYQQRYHCSKTVLDNPLKLMTAISLYSEVMSMRKVVKGEIVGYNHYRLKNDGYILTIPIGYADGVTKDYQFVYINGMNKAIVSDGMDMLMVYSENPIPLHSMVEIFGNHIKISDVCFRTHMNAYHLLNQISNRVVRVHKEEDEKEEITY